MRCTTLSECLPLGCHTANEVRRLSPYEDHVADVLQLHLRRTRRSVRTRTRRTIPTTRSLCLKDLHRALAPATGTTKMPTLTALTTRMTSHYLLVHRLRNRWTRHRYQPDRGAMFPRCALHCISPGHLELPRQYPLGPVLDRHQAQERSLPDNRLYLPHRPSRRRRLHLRLINRTSGRWRHGAPYSPVPPLLDRVRRNGSNTMRRAYRTRCPMRQRRHIRATEWLRQICQRSLLHHLPPPFRRRYFQLACLQNPVPHKHPWRRRGLLRHQPRIFLPPRQ